MLSSYGLGQDAAPPAAPPPSPLQSEIDGFLLTAGSSPSSSDIANFLKLYPSGSERDAAAYGLAARGVDPSVIASAVRFLDTTGRITKSMVFGILSIASAAASGYHGVRRNKGSIGWGLWWFALGSLFPVVTPVIALAQGFAKPKAC